MMILLEIVEMVFAFIGVIWTMQLIASLVNRKQEENICNEKYYIGTMELTGKNNAGTVAIVSLFMKELDDGRSRRAYTARPIEGWERIFNESPFKAELDAWLEGAAFPHQFKPIEPLGEMLNRMLKKKMGVPDA